MKIREGLVSYVNNNPNIYIPKDIPEQYGRVFKIHNNGEILYLPINNNIQNPNNCLTAKQLIPYINYPPEIGELVLIIDVPNNENTSSEKFYLTPVKSNIVNNIQSGELSIQGRNTGYLKILKNELVILSLNKSSLDLDVNKESYLLLSNNNNLDLNYVLKYKNIESLKTFNKEQIILHSINRIGMISKNDLIFKTKNLILSANNIINESDNYHNNSDKIFLGKEANQSSILGDKFMDLIIKMIKELYIFTKKIENVKSSPEGTSIVELNNASSYLSNSLYKLLDYIPGCLSKTIFLQ